LRRTGFARQYGSNRSISVRHESIYGFLTEVRNSSGEDMSRLT
jgi:hypothetical protein